MILKASQRGAAVELGHHLLKAENEHVELHELRGFVADDVPGAMKEAQAVASGTKCRQHLFSVSFNPPQSENPTIGDFERAIDWVEAANGLHDQPRLVIFHEKEGRRHAHCVWSRIDSDTMTARPLPFFKSKLREISKALYLEHGWRMPAGLIDSKARDLRNFTLAEWQQAKRRGDDPRVLKAALQECWAASDDAKSFERSLKDRGIHLAKGDKRGFVVVDFQGDVHSLPRALGLKTKAVAARLGDSGQFPSVDAVRSDVAAQMTSTIKRHVRDARDSFREKSDALNRARLSMAAQHRAARHDQTERQREDWDAGTRNRASRLPRGFKALWWRLTGQYRETRRLNEQEADRQRAVQQRERERLIAAQLAERRALQAKIAEQRDLQAARLNELRRDIGRYMSLTRGRDASAQSPQRKADLGLKLSL